MEDETSVKLTGCLVKRRVRIPLGPPKVLRTETSNEPELCTGNGVVNESMWLRIVQQKGC